MRTKVLIACLVLLMVAPGACHAQGLLRYMFDALSNQLGLDRGPIPKVVVKPPLYGSHQPQPPPHKHPEAYKIYLQAEGF